jgi:hypothetical protein
VFATSEWEKVMNLGILPPEFSVDLEIVEATACYLASEPASVGGECLLDLLLPQQLLAMPVQDESPT